jgi:hypothetical protein
MNSKEFKNLFDKVANKNGFIKAFGGWFKQNPECICVLELQKSSFSDSYYLNIKVFIQGAFGITYLINKELIKSSMGDITKQERDIDILNFEASMDDGQRKEKLEELFIKLIVPFADKTSTRDSIKKLVEKAELVLLPAVKKELQL